MFMYAAVLGALITSESQKLLHLRKMYPNMRETVYLSGFERGAPVWAYWLTACLCLPLPMRLPPKGKYSPENQQKRAENQHNGSQQGAARGRGTQDHKNTTVRRLPGCSPVLPVSPFFSVKSGRF